MMIDYNVSDHWSEDKPEWVKSLVSSLDRRHGSSSVLPLTVIVEEILNWLELASGAKAWRKPANRDSLWLELARSVATLRPKLRTEIDVPLAAFESAFDSLTRSAGTILSQPPGARNDPVWTNVLAKAHALLDALASDGAVGAGWDDLVAVAKNRTLEGREYRPIAELLFDQLGRRGLAPDKAFADVVGAVAFGRNVDDIPIGETAIPLGERIAIARAIACTPAMLEPIVVWLGYKSRVFSEWSAGRVTILDAHWAVPNARPEGQAFEYKAELWELVQHGNLFKVASKVDEESDVDFLVRVDLGVTTAAGAASRATEIVSTILNVSIHNAGGVRPHLAQHGTLWGGRAGSSSFMVTRREPGFPDDHYGARITSDAIDEHGPRIAEALARGELPRFLASAIEMQTSAEYPFSRDMALRKPSEADVSSVIPLSDRVVQHIAAFAAIDPENAFNLLGELWPHSRWLTDVQRAVHMCLLSGGPRYELLEEVTREWYNTTGPWILFVADRHEDLLSLCRIESERAWIARMFRSLDDHTSYLVLIGEYNAEGKMLEARRKRVRNSLVHGNPASFAIVESVREYAEFLSGSALQAGLEAFVSASSPATYLAERTEEFQAMKLGLDAASYWRSRSAAEDPGQKT